MAPTKIKLMTDYGCHPLWWDGQGRVGNIDPALLGLSEELRRELQSWATRYDAILNHDDPRASGFRSRDDEQSFEEDGRSLKAKLEDALGPSFEVRLHL
jgi:hypothetical protein